MIKDLWKFVRERHRVLTGMDGDRNKFDGDRWGRGQIPVPVQIGRDRTLGYKAQDSSEQRRVKTTFRDLCLLLLFLFPLVKRRHLLRLDRGFAVVDRLTHRRCLCCRSRRLLITDTSIFWPSIITQTDRHDYYLLHSVPYLSLPYPTLAVWRPLLPTTIKHPVPDHGLSRHL